MADAVPYLCGECEGTDISNGRQCPFAHLPGHKRSYLPPPPGRPALDRYFGPPPIQPKLYTANHMADPKRGPVFSALESLMSVVRYAGKPTQNGEKHVYVFGHLAALIENDHNRLTVTIKEIDE